MVVQIKNKAIFTTQIFAENLILQQYIYFQEVVNFSPLPITSSMSLNEDV